MEIKLKITLGQTITVLILICIAFAGGFMLNQQKEVITQTQCDSYTGFTEKDLNILGQLAYTSGECERQGLASAIMTQITDANEVYGIPVCVERTGGEEQ